MVTEKSTWKNVLTYLIKKLNSMDYPKKVIQIIISLTCKVGCVFPVVIRSEFRLRQYRDDDHREYAPHFTSKRVHAE